MARHTNRFARIMARMGPDAHKEVEEASSPSSNYHDEEYMSTHCSEHSVEDDPLVTQCSSKSVRFSQCMIRKYPQVLGVHPCCSVGCPLELGWEHESSETLSVDAYEAIRGSTRNSRDIRLTSEERREILKDYSDNEVRRTLRRLDRHRRRKGIVEFFEG